MYPNYKYIYISTSYSFRSSSSFYHTFLPLPLPFFFQLSTCLALCHWLSLFFYWVSLSVYLSLFFFHSVFYNPPSSFFSFPFITFFSQPIKINPTSLCLCKIFKYLVYVNPSKRTSPPPNCSWLAAFEHAKFPSFARRWFNTTALTALHRWLFCAIFQ